MVRRIAQGCDPPRGADAAPDRVLAWMVERYGFFKSKVPRAFQPRAASLGSGCSPDRLARAREFLLDPSRAVSGTAKRLEQVGEQVGDCDRLRDREGAAVRKYLRGLSAGP